MFHSRCNIALFVCPLFLSGIALITGCNAPSTDTECTSNVDCAPGYRCVDGMCSSPRSTADALNDPNDANRQDAGRFAFDAGAPRDSGSVGYDAGAGGADANFSGDADLPDVMGAGGMCGQAACDVQGAECGQVVDACGVTVDCPSTCGAGFACGTGTFANRCQCDPLSCSELGAGCGRITDNCGVSRDCGGCGNGQSCSNNQCQCQRRTCSQAGAQCGPIDDGCGSTRDCGNCGSGQSCNNNQCRCEPRTCQSANVQCGTISDGCGGTVNCGGCTTAWTLFKRAQNVNTGGREWGDLNDGEQFNRQGANVYFGPPSGSTDDCSGSRTSTSDHLWLNDADLSIPANAEVRGIEVRMDIKRNGTTPNVDRISLHSSGAFASSSRARSLSLSTGYRRFTFGGPTDTWGVAASRLTRDALRDNSFGVRIGMSASVRCQSRSEPYVDAAEVRVHYTVRR